ncbi:hypothetical protein SUGI_0450630 [Cryptomeria japonica]|nr:hypothetical protein SUGI_0450630 [Cryptomeria japonica]
MEGRNRGVVDQRSHLLISCGESFPHGPKSLKPYATTLVPVAKSLIVKLTEEIEKEIEHNERIFVGLGLLGTLEAFGQVLVTLINRFQFIGNPLWMAVFGFTRILLGFLLWFSKVWRIETKSLVVGG